MSGNKYRKVFIIELIAVAVVLLVLLVLNLAHVSSPPVPGKIKSTKNPRTEVTKVDTYNQTVLNDKPVAFWAMGSTVTVEKDLSSNGHNGLYKGIKTTVTGMPNTDPATLFSAPGQYLTVPSSPAFSVTTTHQLTWEAWIRPSTLQFTQASSSGYVDWLGKCQNYAPSCEWAARMYDSSNAQGRCDRISAYIFNPSAGLGSGAFWQPSCGELDSNVWLYVVGEYDTSPTPPGCNPVYPGSINIWVDGVEWNQKYHTTTGCMSQYSVQPKASSSPINIGTVSLDTWFQGAIGKVAIYDYTLSQNQINAHYLSMTGKTPDGLCDNTCSLH